MRRLGFLVLGLSFVTLTACKSGYGERCQVTADCEDGLACVVVQSGENGFSECRDDVVQADGGEIDAPQDGPMIDAPPDAAPDAPTDAAIDAPPDA